jgi:hypothetical protein
MTWLAPIPLISEASAETSGAWPLSLPVRPVSVSSGAATPGMSSASAGPTWRWTSVAYEPAIAEPMLVSTPVEPAHVRIPANLVRRMSLEARLAGKSESEVWAEAARAWLQRRERDDDFPPTPPAAAQPCPRRERTAWVAIDALLVDLRARSCEPAAA